MPAFRRQIVSADADFSEAVTTPVLVALQRPEDRDLLSALDKAEGRLNEAALMIDWICSTWVLMSSWILVRSTFSFLRGDDVALELCQKIGHRFRGFASHGHGWNPPRLRLSEITLNELTSDSMTFRDRPDGRIVLCGGDLLARRDLVLVVDEIVVDSCEGSAAQPSRWCSSEYWPFPAPLPCGRLCGRGFRGGESPPWRRKGVVLTTVATIVAVPPPPLCGMRVAPSAPIS